jgi:hypothetical protein
MRKIRSYGFLLVLIGYDTTNGAIGATFSYNDIRKPHGHERGLAELVVDAKFCDQKVGIQTDHITPKYNKCMLSRGWRFGHIEQGPRSNQDSPPSPASPTAGNEQH